jgi:hypothetical protein
VTVEGNYEFLRRVVHNIPGWLQDFAAILTMDLLAYQERQKIAGSLLEIGVFQGRYFSVLLASALRTDSRLVGVDTFQYYSQEVAESKLAEYFEDWKRVVAFRQATSADLSPLGSGLFNAQYMTRMARIALMPPKAMRCRPSETL